MIHELRTPLNAIIGVTEMLREDAEAAKQDLEPLDRVHGAARLLLTLINDILDLSKIEAGRMELHLETFPLVPVIKDVAKTIAPMATKNGSRLVINCPADLGTIHADQTRFRQSLLNLASNANKFSAACAGVAPRVHTASLVVIQLERALYAPLDHCFCWGFWLVEVHFRARRGSWHADLEPSAPLIEDEPARKVPAVCSSTAGEAEARDIKPAATKE